MASGRVRLTEARRKAADGGPPPALLGAALGLKPVSSLEVRVLAEDEEGSKVPVILLLFGQPSPELVIVNDVSFLLSSGPSAREPADVSTPLVESTQLAGSGSNKRSSGASERTRRCSGRGEASPFIAQCVRIGSGAGSAVTGSTNPL